MSKPSQATPRPLDDSSPSSERAHSAQFAIVRTLKDTLERLTARGDAADGLREQLVEELERLHVQQAAAAR
jgi:hypothetical protein